MPIRRQIARALLVSAALGIGGCRDGGRKAAAARQAAIDVARFDLWAAQMLVDAAAGDAAAVNGDFFSLDYVRDRIHDALKEADLAGLNLVLEELNGAVSDEDFEAVDETAGQLESSWPC